MIKEILDKDLKDAIRAHNTAVKNVIRQVFNRVNKFEKEKNTDISDASLLNLIAKELKEVNSTLEFAKDALFIEVTKQKAYLVSIFNQYSPKAMTLVEIEEYILDVLDTTGMERSMKSMKYLILIFKERNPGQDMRIVSGVIKNLLT